jgi:oxygen-dependent protoporphyrinogen oxidase
MRRSQVVAVALLLAVLAAIAARAGIPTFPNYEKGKGAFATSREPESCTSCHFAAPPPTAAAPEEPVERRDVVIVGAGLSGLTAAWRLRDADVLVLEKEARGGGKMKRGEWEGVAFSKGAAYLLEPEGEVKALLDEAGLAPRLIREPVNSAVLGPGKIAIDMWGEGARDLPFDEAGRARLRGAFAAFAKMKDDVAVPARDSKPGLLALDRLTAGEFLDSFGPEARKVIEPYLRSCFAAKADDISALAAVSFFACEFGPTYTFPGGLAALPERLEERLGEKVRHGCFVTEVAPTAGGVRVTYRDAGGAPRRVEARGAIVSCSQRVARHIVQGLSEERKEVMGRVDHGAYAVAAVKTSRPVYEASYDTWFLDGPVTDVIVADWVGREGAAGATATADGAARPAVLSAYMPLIEGGRASLLSTPLDTLRGIVTERLEAAFPALRDSLVGVDLFVHGHAMHIPFPGYLTEVTPKLAAPVAGRIFFAGVELDLPCLESAVWSGCAAAREARAVLAGGGK